MIVLGAVATALFVYSVFLAFHPDAPVVEIPPSSYGALPPFEANLPNIQDFDTVVVGSDLESLLAAALLGRVARRRVLLLCQLDESDVRGRIRDELRIGVEGARVVLRAAVDRVAWRPITQAGRVVEAVGVEGEIVHAVERGRRKWIGSLLATFPSHRGRLLRLTRDMRTACYAAQAASVARELLGERAFRRVCRVLGTCWAPARWLAGEERTESLMRRVADLPRWAIDAMTGGEAELAMDAASSMPSRVEGRLTTNDDVVDAVLRAIYDRGGRAYAGTGNIEYDSSAGTIRFDEQSHALKDASSLQWMRPIFDLERVATVEKIGLAGSITGCGARLWHYRNPHDPRPTCLRVTDDERVVFDTDVEEDGARQLLSKYYSAHADSDPIALERLVGVNGSPNIREATRALSAATRHDRLGARVRGRTLEEDLNIAFY